MHPDGHILQRGPPIPAARIAAGCYFLVLLGLLGLVVLLGLLGLLGLVVLLGLLVLPLELGDELLLPLVDPPVLLPLEEPDLLKYASHSVREIEPSLFVSTAEKLGAMLLDELSLDDPPLEALPPLDMPEELGELLEEPVALGEELEPEEEPFVDDPAAMDTPAIAKSAAAVAVPTIFNIGMFLLRKD